MKTLHEKQIKSDNSSSVLRENSFSWHGTSNLSGGKPIKIYAVWRPSQQNIKGIKNIIVNPLLSVQLDQQVSVLQQDSLPTVNKSSRPGLKGMFSKENSSVFEQIYTEISQKLSCDIEKEVDEGIPEAKINS